MIDEVLKKPLKLYTVFTVTAALVCVFINWRLSTGILAEYPAVLLFAKMLTSDAENVIFFRKELKFYNNFGMMLRLTVLVIPLLLGIKFSQYLNVYAAFAGLMLFRVSLFAVNWKLPEYHAKDDTGKEDM